MFPTGKSALQGKPVSPYSFVNPITGSQARKFNNEHRQGIQGFTFNIPNGNSTQPLQLPGDIFLLFGLSASWDDATFAGFNNVFTFTVNNDNIFNAVNVMLLNVNRMTAPPYYVPIQQQVSPTSVVTISFNNGTGVTLTNFNFLLWYC